MRTLCFFVLLSSLPAATFAADADADADDSSDDGQGTAQEQAVMNDPGIQGAMLLSAALPHHGPAPPKELMTKMEEAGPLVYDAYSLVQAASGDLEGVSEQLKTGIDVKGNSISSDIAFADEQLQRAQAKFKKGNNLRMSAEATLQNNADPLGDPPEAPKSWGNVDSMAGRTQSKIGLVQQQAAEVKRLAQGKGLSLLTVATEKTTVLSDDPNKAADDKLLDWLGQY